jgi:hypothetical protein
MLAASQGPDLDARNFESDTNSLVGVSVPRGGPSARPAHSYRSFPEPYDGIGDELALLCIEPEPAALTAGPSVVE